VALAQQVGQGIESLTSRKHQSPVMDKFDAALALALLVGIILTGQLVSLIGPDGPAPLRYAIWITGYGGAVVAAWAFWLRPLDLRAPGGDDESVWGPDDGDAADAER